MHIFDNKYSLKSDDGKNNLCGKKIKEYRLSLQPPVTQQMLAEELQRKGLEMDRYIILRIEKGERYVSDIELKAIADALGVSTEYLLS